MLQIYNKYNPNANPANTDYPNGSGKDESVEGANDGTPLEMSWYNDMLGFSESLLAQGRLTPSGNADTALVSDRLDGFRLAALRVQTACDYTDGDLSLVDVIYVGLDIATVDYVIDRNTLTRWAVGTAFGTVTADDLNVGTGALSGVTGALTIANTVASYVGGEIIATGSAVFNNTDNSITLAGVGVGVEVGDVINIAGSASNSKEFTIEIITDANNIIVNQAHAGGTTSKSLVSETATVTVKLLCKWYLAQAGMGQGWVIVPRVISTPYTNATQRSIKMLWNKNGTTVSQLFIDGVGFQADGANNTYGEITLPKNVVYSMTGNIVLIRELR